MENGKNFSPILREDFDERRAINEPPPWPLGGPIGQKRSMETIVKIEVVN